MRAIKKKKKGKGKKEDKVDYNLNQGASGASVSASIAEKKWASNASKEELLLGSKKFHDGKGGFVVRTRTTSKA
jgi:hypothetical protein